MNNEPHFLEGVAGYHVFRVCAIEGRSLNGYQVGKIFTTPLDTPDSLLKLIQEKLITVFRMEHPGITDVEIRWYKDAMRLEEE